MELTIALILLLLVLCAWLCRLYPSYWGRLCALALLLAVITIPLLDLVPGLAYYSYLCTSEAEQDTYRELLTTPVYQLKNGDPDIEAIRRDLIYLQHETDVDPLGLLSITRNTTYIVDRETHKTIGTIVDFAHDGDWLLDSMFPSTPSRSCWDGEEDQHIDHLIARSTHFSEDSSFLP